MMRVLTNDISRQFYMHQEEYEEKALQVLRSGWYVLGNEVKEFEKEFASFIENRDYFKCFDMKKEYGSMIQSAGRHASEKLKFDFKRTPAQFEAVLNKNQKIYQNG